MSPEHVDPATRRTYKYRLYPTPTQVLALEEQLGACCNIYNAALEQAAREVVRWYDGRLDAGGALRLEPVTAAVARLRSALSPNQPEGE